MASNQGAANEGGSERLGAARLRRVELKQAMSQVEIAAAGAAGDPTWRGDLRVAMDDLLLAFDGHVNEVDGPGGLLAELIETAPRLSNRVSRLGDEHPALRARIALVIEQVGSAEVADVRGEVLDVLVEIARHRQQGADLVYDAYHVDIGGE
jgi:hypothetical protein